MSLFFENRPFGHASRGNTRVACNYPPGVRSPENWPSDNIRTISLPLSPLSFSPSSAIPPCMTCCSGSVKITRFVVRFLCHTFVCRAKEPMHWHTSKVGVRKSKQIFNQEAHFGSRVFTFFYKRDQICSLGVIQARVKRRRAEPIAAQEMNSSWLRTLD